MEFSDAIFTDDKKRCFLDKITGLNNKTGMKYLLGNLIKQHKRYEDNWALILLTIKDEEKLTKTLKNNAAIKAVAQKLNSSCRTSDILFYLGDYYFCILTRVFDKNDTDEFIAKIRNNIDNVLKIGNNINFASEYGTAFMTYNDSAESMLNRAFYSLPSVK